MFALCVMVLPCANGDCRDYYTFVDNGSVEDAVKLLTCRSCGAQKEYRRGRDCIEETALQEYKPN